MRVSEGGERAEGWFERAYGETEGAASKRWVRVKETAKERKRAKAGRREAKQMRRRI